MADSSLETLVVPGHSNALGVEKAVHATTKLRGRAVDEGPLEWGLDQ